MYEVGELRPFFTEYLESEISLATLYGIAGAIESRYRDDGYVPEPRHRPGAIGTVTASTVSR